MRLDNVYESSGELNSNQWSQQLSCRPFSCSLLTRSHPPRRDICATWCPFHKEVPLFPLFLELLRSSLLHPSERSSAWVSSHPWGLSCAYLYL
jgi:hypothetical protein